MCSVKLCVEPKTGHAVIVIKSPQRLKKRMDINVKPRDFEEKQPLVLEVLPVYFSLSASRLPLLLSEVMKPIYILNQLSGECWGQEKVCYYNNQVKGGVV